MQPFCWTRSSSEKSRASTTASTTWRCGTDFWNTYQLDLPIVGALIAPRPLRIINARKDVAFPPTGYNVVHEQLQPLYEWYGVPDKLDTFEADTGHADLPPYRKAANEWLNR